MTVIVKLQSAKARFPDVIEVQHKAKGKGASGACIKLIADGPRNLRGGEVVAEFWEHDVIEMKVIP